MHVSKSAVAGIAVAVLLTAASAARANDSLSSFTLTQSGPVLCIAHDTENAGVPAHTLFVPGGAVAITSTYQGGPPPPVSMPGTFSLSRLTELGPVTQTRVNGASFDSALFAGGSFAIRGADAAKTLLLSGDFAGATLSGPDGVAGTAKFQIANINYSGGAYLSQYTAAAAGVNRSAQAALTGNLVLNLTGPNPTPLRIASDGYFSHFDVLGGSASGAFDVRPQGPSAVPEPSSLALLTLGGFGLGGLLLRARKSRRLA